MIQLQHRSPRILVVGDLMIDHYLWGTCERISPEAPVPVIDVGRDAVALGGAGNVMNNLLALGAQVVGASVIGQDDNGQDVLEMLQQGGVDTSCIVCEAGRVTSRKTRIVATHQQVLRFDCESKQPIGAAAEKALLENIQALEPFQLVLLSDYNKGVLTPSLTRAIVALARQRGVPVLVDPKGKDYSKYRGATLLTPNKKEAAEATGIAICDDASLRRAGERLRKELDLEWAMITLSEEGLALFGDEMVRIRAVAREVFDVTGAGDTVLATLGFSLACRMPMPEAARLANSAAAVAIGKLGTATVSWDEILQYESQLKQDGLDDAIKSLDAAERLAEQLRRQGKRIVLTNGCFDLLHRGHLECLRASRECGDVLIVGLNSDQSVRRLKGPQRPVTNQDDRAHMLAALRLVDYVVVFDEDTPYNLVRRIKPDVLTKGSDYAGKPIVGSELVSEVRLIHFVEGRSTSVTIDRIRTAA